MTSPPLANGNVMIMLPAPAGECDCALHRSLIPYETPLTKLRKSYCTIFTMIAIVGTYYFATHPSDVRDEWPVFNCFILALLILGGCYLCVLCMACNSYEQEEVCVVEREIDFGVKWGARLFYVGLMVGGIICIVFGAYSTNTNIQSFLLCVGSTILATFLFITVHNWRHNSTLPF